MSWSGVLSRRCWATDADSADKGFGFGGGQQRGGVSQRGMSFSGGFNGGNRGGRGGATQKSNAKGHGGSGSGSVGAVSSGAPSLSTHSTSSPMWLTPPATRHSQDYIGITVILY